ncbi:MAG: LamG domain-containing protein, partial [Candidatus Poribacteria bacterium]
EDITSGNSGKFLLNGLFGYKGPALDIGTPLYLSTTAGEIADTAPSGSGKVVQILGTNLGILSALTHKPKHSTALKTGTWHTTDLLSFWSFQEGTGTTLTDIYGGYNATLYNFASPPTSTSGWNTESAGKVLAFDGTNDYCQTSATFPTSSVMTVSMWLKQESSGQSWRTFIKTTGNSDYGVFQIRMRVSGPNKIELVDSTVNVRYTSTTQLSWSQWYHIVAVFDGTNAYLYINGQLDGSTSSWTAIPSGTYGIVIGYGRMGSYPFSGRMDDIKIWNRALSPSEIVELYNDRYGIYFFGNRIYFNPNQKIEVNP